MGYDDPWCAYEAEKTLESEYESRPLVKGKKLHEYITITRDGKLTCSAEVSEFLTKDSEYYWEVQKLACNVGVWMTPRCLGEHAEMPSDIPSDMYDKLNDVYYNNTDRMARAAIMITPW